MVNKIKLGLTGAIIGAIALGITCAQSVAASPKPAIMVHMTNDEQFAPATISVHVGDTVEWSNVSQAVHTVTDDPKKAAYPKDAVVPAGAATFNSGFINPGGTYEHTFTVAGTYQYFCIPHETNNMLGTVVVIPKGAATTGAAPATAAGVATMAAVPSISKALFPTHVFVTLERTGAVELFPEQKLWTGFPQAHYIASSLDGRLLLVSGFQDGDVYIADAHSGKKLATLHVGGLIQGVKIDPSGRYGLAVDASQNSVALIDMAARKIVQMIPVGKTPHNAVFSHDGKTAYVTLQGQHAVAIVDMIARKKVGEIELPQMDGPHNVDISADGKTLWVRSHSQPTEPGQVAAVDLRTNRVLGYTTVGFYHGGMDIRPQTGYAFTADIGANTADVLDARTRALVKQIDVGAGPHGVRLSPDGRYAYVSVTRANTLVVIDTHTLSVVQTIPVRGEDPFWLAVEGNE